MASLNEVVLEPNLDYIEEKVADALSFTTMTLDEYRSPKYWWNDAFSKLYR